MPYLGQHEQFRALALCLRLALLTQPILDDLVLDDYTIMVGLFLYVDVILDNGGSIDVTYTAFKIFSPTTQHVTYLLPVTV